MCGQALVPLTGPGLWGGFHEVPLQLTDAGMVPEQVLLRLIELLYGGKSRGETKCGEGEGGKEGARNLEHGNNKRGKKYKVKIKSWMGREREDKGYVCSWERLTNRRE